MTTKTLPSPVSAYVEATNTFNLDGFVAAVRRRCLGQRPSG